MKAALLLTIVVMLAGCQEDPPRQDHGIGTENSTTTSNPDPALQAEGTQTRRVELLDCATYFLFYPVDMAKLSAKLPAGYTAMYSTPTAGLDAYVCRSAIIDNSTVLHDVQWYAASVLVEPPQQVKLDNGANIYHFETCINDPTLAGVFAEAGFVVCQGLVDAQLGLQTLELAFHQAGALTYAYRGAGELGNGSVPRQETVRIHQASNFPTWFDQDGDVMNPSRGEAGIMEVVGGEIMTVLAHPGPGTIAHSGIGRGDYVLHFDATNATMEDR